MENAIGNIVAYWFVAQTLLTGAAVVAWLAWGFGGLVRCFIRNVQKSIMK